MANESIDARVASLLEKAPLAGKAGLLREAAPGIDYFVLFSYTMETAGSGQDERTGLHDGLALYSTEKKSIETISSSLNTIPEDRFKFDMKTISRLAGYSSQIIIYDGEPIASVTGGGNIFTLKAPRITHEELARGLRNVMFAR